MDPYVTGFSFCLLAGLGLIAIGHYYPDVRNSRLLSYYFSDQVINAPLEEMVGGFLSGLGAGGLAGLTYTKDPGVSAFLGFVLGAIATGKVFLERADTWDEHAVDDTIGAPRPTAGFIGREARVAATIEAGQFGEITFRDDDGQVYGLAATADVDIAVGAAVTITGTKGLDLVVAPRSR